MQSETAVQGEVLTKQLVSNVWGVVVAEWTGTKGCMLVSSEIDFKSFLSNNLLTQQDPDSHSYRILNVCTVLGTRVTQPDQICHEPLDPSQAHHVDKEISMQAFSQSLSESVQQKCSQKNLALRIVFPKRRKPKSFDHQSIKTMPITNTFEQHMKQKMQIHAHMPLDVETSAYSNTMQAWVQITSRVAQLEINGIYMQHVLLINATEMKRTHL